MILFPQLTPFAYVFCAFVALFGGFTKGVTGFGLPIILVSGMAMLIDPKLAIATIVIPTAISNFWQALAQGWREAAKSFQKHAILLLTTLAMIYINAQWVGRLNFNMLLALLGAVIAILSIIQILGVTIKIKPENAKIGAFFIGQISGFFGAIAGIWGPTTIIYLLALNTPKIEQTRVAGILFCTGAIMFWFAHSKSGLITAEAIGLSILLLIPVTIGQYFGQIAQGKIDQQLFRKVTLWVLLFAGLNVFRKAVMG